MLKIYPIPKPYQAMLAICSDLDETANAETYFETIKYLNSSGNTKHGMGVDLEVGNTIYFDMPSDQFSYWNCSDSDRQTIHSLIQSGHIDCFHSFGDFVNQRQRVKELLTELERNNSRLPVWIDHAIAPTNIDPDIMRGRGDQPQSDCYHTDLTTKHGVKYVWLGRVSSVIGQDTKRRLSNIWSGKCSLKSTITVIKEFTKGVLPKLGHKKYEMHLHNEVLRPKTLNCGTQVWEFIRCNPSPWGVSVDETGDGIGNVLTKRFLDSLIQRHGKCVLYTHLGKLSGVNNTFTSESKNAFELLKQYQKKNEILVTTTKRLLDYSLLIKTIEISSRFSQGVQNVSIKNSQNLPLDGLTFGVEDKNIKLEVDGKENNNFDLRQLDHGYLVCFPWPRLTLPEC